MPTRRAVLFSLLASVVPGVAKLAPNTATNMKVATKQGGSGSFYHIQNEPAWMWRVYHNLNIKYPIVYVEADGGGEVICGDVVKRTSNILTISFSAPLAGIAIIKE